MDVGHPMTSMAAMRSFRRDPSVTGRELPKGTVRRVLGIARPYRRELIFFLLLVVASSVIGVITPLLAGDIINRIAGLHGTAGGIVKIALIIAGLAVLDAAISLCTRWFSARIGEGVIYDLRSRVFEHVQRMPVAFFTRTQTGALVSRLNNDVIGAQQAFTSTLSGVVSNVIGLVLTAGVMFSLSWQITLLSLILVPLFVLPARRIGKRLQEITRESYGLNASMNATMTERFNVAGALLVKLFGRPSAEADAFRGRAARVRDIGVLSAMYGRTFFTALTLVAALATALVYGLGGWLAFTGSLSAGDVVALALLLSRLYGPLTALANVRVDVMSAMVSFDRVFEVLDLQPMIRELPDAVPVPAGDRSIEFDARVLQLPLRRRRLAAVTGGGVAARARRAGRRPARRLLPRRTRAPGGAGRALRRGEVDDREPGDPALRRHRRERAGRRRRRPAGDAGLAAGRDRGRQPGRAPLPRQHPGQPALRPARGDRGRALDRDGGGPDRGPRALAARGPRHRRRRPRATGCPAGRSSGWRSPACCSRARAS